MVEQVPHNNGSSPQPQPQQPAAPLPVPSPCRVLYQELPNGARVVQGVEIAGVVFGNVLRVSTEFDVTRPSNESKALIRHVLEVAWPFEWVDVAKQQPDLLVATKLPPDPRFPPRGPHPIR